MALTVIENSTSSPVSTNQIIEDGVVAFEDTRIGDPMRRSIPNRQNEKLVHGNIK
jgi:hypothetical protein